MCSATEGSAAGSEAESPPAGENYGATSGTLMYHDLASLPAHSTHAEQAVSHGGLRPNQSHRDPGKHNQIGWVG